MSTTNLFVELIVIGVSAAIWVILLVMSAVGFEEALVRTLTSPVLAIAVLSVIYVLGIVTDRLADVVFEKLWAKRLREKWFSRIGDYYEARRDMFENSPGLAELFEYSRSRLRICRGWAFNSVLSAVALAIFLLTPSFAWLDKPRVFVFGTLGLFLLTLGAGYAWRRIAESEYRKLHEYIKTSKRQNESQTGGN